MEPVHHLLCPFIFQLMLVSNFTGWFPRPSGEEHATEQCKQVRTAQRLGKYIVCGLFQMACSCHVLRLSVVERHSRSSLRPKHAALLPVQPELPNEDDDSEQCAGVMGSASGMGFTADCAKFNHQTLPWCDAVPVPLLFECTLINSVIP